VFVRPLVSFASVAACLCLSVAALAADLPRDVLAKSQWMQLTRSDYEAALSRVPKQQRDEFAMNPKRVQMLLNGLLVTKTLAAQARLDGVRPADGFANLSGPDADKALADAELKRIESDASRAFDAQKAAFEAKAREVYKLHADKYRVPEEVRVSDIAVTTKDRGEDAARQRAEEARKRIVAGEDFAKVAREFSDDPTTRDKGGALPFVSRDRLTRDFANGVFALTRIGEVSQPIKGASAWHVVRLEERRPARQRAFEEVRDGIMKTLRERYVAEQRERRIREINGDASLVVNQAAVDALVTHVDPAGLAGAARAPAPAPAK
jgi:peptidyl-prolyl cis-trans isomerase C